MGTEELELSLNQDEAVALLLLLDISRETLKERIHILSELKDTPKDQQPPEVKDVNFEESINLANELLIKCKDFTKEVGEIVVELEKEKDKPLIIPKPDFKNQKS